VCGRAGALRPLSAQRRLERRHIVFPGTVTSPHQDGRGERAACPLVSSRLPKRKNKGRNTWNNSNEITALGLSGRLDLNQRPLGPEPLKADSLALARSGTELQALQISRDAIARATQIAAGAKPSDAGLVAALSPRPRPRLCVLDPFPEQLLNVSAVADALGVCRATVYRLCKEGSLEHVRIGDDIRFRRADLGSFIARSRSRKT